MVPRPCPFLQCRHNIGNCGRMGNNCSLDFAEWGGMTQREVARAMGLKLKDVQQIEQAGMRKLKNGLRED